MEPLLLAKNPVIIAAVVAIALTIHKLRAYYRLRQFAGPPLSGFTDLLLSNAIYNADAHLWYANVSEKYGKIARIAPNVLLTSSPELWAYTNKDKRYTRPAWFYHSIRFEHRKDSIFSQIDNDKHDETRRQLAPGYSGRENHELEGSIDTCVSELIHLIRSKYISTNSRIVPIDMSMKIQYLALDVISIVAYGRAFGMLATDSDVNDYIKSTTEGLWIFRAVWATGIHWLLHAPLVGKIFEMSTEDERGFGKMSSSAFAVINERAANPKEKRADMLASFMRNGLAGGELRSEVMGQIVAGSDTTATAIRGIIMHIVSNPRVCDNLRAEIDSAHAPENTVISYAKAKSLPHLQAVIREGMRVWIPGTNFFPRVVPEDGDHAPLGDGKTVVLPGGTIIGPSVVAMHRNKEVFGEDADVFKPERWLGQERPRLDKMKQINDLIFSVGRYGCLGKPVAMIEMSKVIFELFRNFEIASTNPTKPWEAKSYLGLSSITDMWMQVMERKRV